MIGFTKATAANDGSCVFTYPSGFNNTNCTLLCVRYINSFSKPKTESGTVVFYGNDFSVEDISVVRNTEVTAILLKHIISN